MNNFTHEMRWKFHNGNIGPLAYFYNDKTETVYQRAPPFDEAAIDFPMEKLRPHQEGWYFIPINLIEANE